MGCVLVNVEVYTYQMDMRRCIIPEGKDSDAFRHLIAVTIDDILLQTDADGLNIIAFR